MKKVLVISDNHGSLKNIQKLITSNNYDYVIHCGDYCCNYNDLHQMHHKFYVIPGNNDFNYSNDLFHPDGLWDQNKGIYKITIEGLKFMVIHGHLHLPWSTNKDEITKRLGKIAENYDCDFVLFGHTHVDFLSKYKNIYVCNPGSINFPRNLKNTKTYLEITINTLNNNEKDLLLDFKTFK